MSRIQKFLTNLFTPEVTPKAVRESKKAGVTPVSQALFAYAATELLGGPDTTIMDRVTFIAAPFALEAVAQRGAQNGNSESEEFSS